MLMEYSDKEKQILSLMQRTDFKNLSKREDQCKIVGVSHEV